MLVRKKAPFGDAIQWTGDNTNEVVAMLQATWKEDGIWVRQLWKDGAVAEWRLVLFEGELEAKVGDWIIKRPESNYGMIVVSGEGFVQGYEPING